MAEIILLADDDPKIVELVQVILENRGYEIHWARDGEETLEKAKTLVPDLVLLDVLMPKLNGYEVAHLMRENPVLKDIAVIFLTAKNEPEDKVAGLRAGGADYITKPFDIYELLARIEAVLRIRGVSGAEHRNNRRLTELSLADPLTGLYNQHHFLERFSEEVARAVQREYPVACMVLDIDQFQMVNDRFGPRQGDQVLQRLAFLLQRTNRVVDLVGRWQDDQFILQLPQTDLGGAEAVGRRIIQQVKRSHLVSADPAYAVTISLGLAAYSGQRRRSEVDAQEIPETLIENTRQVWKQAKERGGNQIITSGTLL